VLTDRARDATLLVLGADRDGSTVAQQVREGADCTVMTVAVG